MLRISLRVRLWAASVFAAVAISSIFLHTHFRRDLLPVVIWWETGTTDVVRHAAEVRLGLVDGHPRRDAWTYRLLDYSPDAVGAVVRDPLVRLTENIDRKASRVVINAPALPVFIQRGLANSLGIWV